MKVVVSNPCDALERPKVIQSLARGLTGDQIHKLLDAVPTTPVDLRDRAIILTLTFTGQRRAEVRGMTASSISDEGRSVFYSYRGKGGKTGRREMPRPAFEAIRTWLAVVGRDLTKMRPDESLWPDTRHGCGITGGTFYTNLRRYLAKAGLPLAGAHLQAFGRQAPTRRWRVG